MYKLLKRAQSGSPCCEYNPTRSSYALGNVLDLMRTATSVARARETVLQAAQQRDERVALFRKDQRLYGPENLAIRLSRNGISEKLKLIFRNTKKLKTFFSRTRDWTEIKEDNKMDPGHLMLNRSIFSLYPNLAAQLAASPPLLQNWGIGRPHPAFQQTQLTPPAGEFGIKLERDSCGGSSASNASDTNGSGDEVSFLLLLLFLDCHNPVASIPRFNP